MPEPFAVLAAIVVAAGFALLALRFGADSRGARAWRILD